VNDPITLTDRLHSAYTALTFSAVTLWITREMLRAWGRNSPARRRHGRILMRWMAAGCLVGGIYGVVHIQRSPVDDGWTLFGMLIGWFFGSLHGVMGDDSESDVTPRPPAE